jgi:triphosphatase
VTFWNNRRLQELTSPMPQISRRYDPMKAPRETELKLEIPIEAVPKLKESRLLRGLPGKAADLVSVYFDTGKLNLRKEGISLRVRQIEGQFLQAVKLNEPGNGAALRRDEWETEINDKNLDLEAARRTALEPLLTKKVCRALKPIFETQVRRTTYPVRYDGSEIEVSIDEGRIEAGHRWSRLHEIELELKQGDSPALFRLAHQIVKNMPAMLGVKSKADRGYELLTGESSRPVKAFSVKLVPKQSPQSALQSIARACLHQLCANTAPLRAGDAEALHQARVSIRRLRVAISLFSDLLRDKQTDGIKRELKWLTGEFGPAREADVFMERVVKPVAEADHKTRGVRELRDDVIESRNAHLARAQSAIDTARFRALALAIATWIETGDWMHPGDARRDLSGERTIAEIAVEQLNSRWKKLVKRGKHIDALDPHQRHKLRIAAKKLRYASEFFAHVFPGRNAGRRRKRFVASLKALQVCLGDLNDIVVNERLSASLVSSPARRERIDDEVWKAFTAGRLCGREEARVSSVMKAAMRAHKVFVGAKRFWI